MYGALLTRCGIYRTGLTREGNLNIFESISIHLRLTQHACIHTTRTITVISSLHGAVDNVKHYTSNVQQAFYNIPQLTIARKDLLLGKCHIGFITKAKMLPAVGLKILGTFYIET